MSNVINYADLFNPKPIGEQVNVHVHRVAPEKEPDYAAMQRFIETSAESITTKSSPRNERRSGTDGGVGRRQRDRTISARHSVAVAIAAILG
jgi:hypothetical protein